MTFTVSVRDLGVRFGDTAALDGVTFDLAAGTIVGLLGRNGAGKSTLLSTLAAFRRPTSGQVLVDGEDPYEHRRLTSEIALVREDGDLDGSRTVGHSLEVAGRLRPRWDREVAERLLERFQVPAGKKVCALSRGQRSAVAVTIGIATRAPLTMFDEPHLGMDAPARYAFYDALLADYIEHPRTVVVSTHLIDEMASMLEDVVIVDHGRVLAHQPSEELAARGVELTGPTPAVDELTRDMSVLSRRTLGPTTSAVVFGDFNGHLRDHASRVGVTLGPIPLQDLFVSLTSQELVP
jgi:ABC-2 type transport system ATP-binding protein